MLSGQLFIKGEHVINFRDKINFESQVCFHDEFIGRRGQTILKLKTANGAQLGVIDDNQISFMISNLMDDGICEFEGQILPTSNNTNEKTKFRGDEIFLKIKVYMLVCLNVHFFFINYYHFETL